MCGCISGKEKAGLLYEVTDVILWRTERENTLTLATLCSFPEGVIR